MDINNTKFVIPQESKKDAYSMTNIVFEFTTIQHTNNDLPKKQRTVR